MLTAIRYKSFKSLVDTVLPLEPLTIMIGTNSSGKTNTLEGLNVLRALATGTEIGQTLSGSEIRGRASDCAPFGEYEFTLGCDFESPLPYKGDLCRYEIEIKNFNIPLINMEKLRFFSEYKDQIIYKKPPIYTSDGVPNTQIYSIDVKVDNFARGGKKPGFTFNARIPILFQLLPRISEGFKGKKFYESAMNSHKKITSDLLKSFSSILIIDPKPDLVRNSGYIKKETNFIDKFGINLSGVLFNLFKDDLIKNRIEKILHELPEHEILKINFDETTGDEVRLVIEERFGGENRKVALELLSDGTIRLLVILAAVFSISEGGLMVIEEIDTSLHPSKVESLLRLLEAVAMSNNIRLLLTSHNPTLMDSVAPQKLRDVILCFRDSQTSHSKLIRVTDIPESPQLLISNSLGGLAKSRRLEKLLKKSLSEREQERQQKLSLWQQRMQQG